MHALMSVKARVLYYDPVLGGAVLAMLQLEAAAAVTRSADLLALRSQVVLMSLMSVKQICRSLENMPVAVAGEMSSKRLAP